MEYNDTNLIELYSAGQSYAEIARAMVVSRNKVSGRLQRIKKKPAYVQLEAQHVLARQVSNAVVLDKVKFTPIRKTTPNKYSLAIKPYGYLEPTKGELRMMLKQALENSK